MPTFRNRPVEIEAVQWTGDNADELREFTRNRFRVVEPTDRGSDPRPNAEVFDVLHSTWVGLRTSDWIICGVQGEFYPIKDAILRETYERVTD